MIKKIAIGIAAVFALLLLLGACLDESKPVASGDGAPVAEQTRPEPAAEPEPEPQLTFAQENAIRSAQSYLEMSGFSRAGLIDQLSSEYGDKFSRKNAKFAVDHIEVNWNEQAVRAGRDYLELSGFSRAGLIDQLSSEYGDKFTVKQATYAANKLGL